MLEILLAVVAGYWLYTRIIRPIRQEQQLASAPLSPAQEKRAQDDERYADLANRFSIITGVDPLGLFKLASKDRGFGWSENEIERHYLRFCEDREFPNYVELFLDHEEQNINENYPHLGRK